MLKIQKELREGDMIPKYYGVAYRRIDKLTVVCYPIPLNIIMALLNKMVIWFKHGHGLWNTGYHDGYDKGFDKGRKYAFEQYRGQVKKQEIKNIVENFMNFEEKLLKEKREGKNIDGWIYRFIEQETQEL